VCVCARVCVCVCVSHSRAHFLMCDSVCVCVCKEGCMDERVSPQVRIWLTLEDVGHVRLVARIDLHGQAEVGHLGRGAKGATSCRGEVSGEEKYRKRARGMGSKGDWETLFTGDWETLFTVQHTHLGDDAPALGAAALEHDVADLSGDEVEGGREGQSQKPGARLETKRVSMLASQKRAVALEHRVADLLRGRKCEEVE
jgi:hypothetical protein